MVVGRVAPDIRLLDIGGIQAGPVKLSLIELQLNSGIGVVSRVAQFGDLRLAGLPVLGIFDQVEELSAVGFQHKGTCSHRFRVGVLNGITHT